MDNNSNSVNSEKSLGREQTSVHSFFTKEKLETIYYPLRLKIVDAQTALRTLLYSTDMIYPLTERRKQIMLASVLKIRSGLSSAVVSKDYLELVQNAFIIEDILHFALTFADAFDEVESFDKKQVSIFRQEMLAFNDLFKLWVDALKSIDDEALANEGDFFNV